jgi:hypothetical protein
MHNETRGFLVVAKRILPTLARLVGTSQVMMFCRSLPKEVATTIAM